MTSDCRWPSVSPIWASAIAIRSTFATCRATIGSDCRKPRLMSKASAASSMPTTAIVLPSSFCLTTFASMDAPRPKKSFTAGHHPLKTTPNSTLPAYVAGPTFQEIKSSTPTAQNSTDSWLPWHDKNLEHKPTKPKSKHSANTLIYFKDSIVPIAPIVSIPLYPPLTKIYAHLHPSQKLHIAFRISNATLPLANA